MRLFALLLVGAFMLGLPATSTTVEAADKGMNKSMAKDAMMKKDEMSKKDEMMKGGMKKDAMHKGSMGKDSTMKKDDMMKKDAMPKGAMSK